MVFDPRSQLAELLAIKLFENDPVRRRQAAPLDWLDLAEEDRKIYREMADGRRPVPKGTKRLFD